MPEVITPVAAKTDADDAAIAAGAAQAVAAKGSRPVIGRLYLEVRQSIPAWKHILFVSLSLLVGLVICVVVLAISGVDLSSVFEEFIIMTFFDSIGLANILVQASPLVLVGLSAAIAFRVNFWNIGIEGQFFMGVVGATMIAFYNVGPADFRIYLMFVFACIFGAAWTLAPVLLKVRLGVNEVITTLLLNYIAYYFVLNQIYGPWQDPVDRFSHTEKYDVVERLPLLGWEQVHAGLFFSIAAVALIWWLLERSRFGLYARFVGANARMALAAGVPVVTVIVVSVLLSGALSGAAGYVMAAAQEFRMTPSMAAGYGFSGIVIAFLARNHPIGVLGVAFLMGGLYVAGQSIKVFYSLPAATVGLIQAIIVLSVTASDFFIRYRLHRAR